MHALSNIIVVVSLLMGAAYLLGWALMAYFFWSM